MKDRIALCWKCKIFYAIVFVAFLAGIFFLLYRVSTPIPRNVTVTVSEQAAAKNKQASAEKKQTETTTPEYYATYDLFNKHFTLLFTVFGTLLSIFGVVIPLAFYFYQQNQFKAEIIKVSHDFRTKQNNLEQKISNINTREVEKLKKDIVRQQESLDSVKEKLQADFKSKTDELIQNEKEIELNFRYKIILLIKNHIISNMYFYGKNKLKESTFYPLVLISYVLFCQIMTESLELLKHDKAKYKAASIIMICFNGINKIKSMTELYDEVNGNHSYKEICDHFLGEYKDLFEDEFIEFLEEVKRREKEKSSASEEE